MLGPVFSYYETLVSYPENPECGKPKQFCVTANLISQSEILYLNH